MLNIFCNKCLGKGEYKLIGHNPCPYCFSKNYIKKNNNIHKNCFKCNNKKNYQYSICKMCKICSGKGKIIISKY